MKPRQDRWESVKIFLALSVIAASGLAAPFVPKVFGWLVDFIKTIFGG